MGLNKLISASETLSADKSLAETEKKCSLEEFASLLKLEDVEVYMLQAYAHKLMEQGIAFTAINASAHPYFEGALCRKGQELERARQIAEGFAGEPFYWNCWMEK